jgi:hypothetical protein
MEKSAMTRPKKPVPDDKSQLAAFKKAARELGSDNSEERFQEALRTVAKAKPSDRAKPPAK